MSRLKVFQIIVVQPGKKTLDTLEKAFGYDPVKLEIDSIVYSLSRQFLGFFDLRTIYLSGINIAPRKQYDTSNTTSLNKLTISNEFPLPLEKFNQPLQKESIFRSYFLSSEPTKVISQEKQQNKDMSYYQRMIHESQTSTDCVEQNIKRIQEIIHSKHPYDQFNLNSCLDIKTPISVSQGIQSPNLTRFGLSKRIFNGSLLGSQDNEYYSKNRDFVTTSNPKYIEEVGKKAQDFYSLLNYGKTKL